MGQTGVAAALLLLAFGGGMQLWINPAWLVITGLAVALLAISALGGADMRRAMVLFGWYWPPCWVLASAAGHWDNQNIASVWSVAAIIALLPPARRWDWLAVAANGLLLLWFGSRGAIIGLWAGLLVGLWPLFFPRMGLLSTGIVLPALGLLRPTTAWYRLGYWRGALDAWQSAPWLGVGYGGLQRGCWMPEAGDCQIHAHNLFIHVLAEFGIVGLALLLVGLGLALLTPRPRWEVAIIAALLAHSMVDLPVFWIGPLALFLVVTVKTPSIFTPLSKIVGVKTNKFGSI